MPSRVAAQRRNESRIHAAAADVYLAHPAVAKTKAARDTPIWLPRAGARTEGQYPGAAADPIHACYARCSSAGARGIPAGYAGSIVTKAIFGGALHPTSANSRVADVALVG